jgi:hypothetical protein
MITSGSSGVVRLHVHQKPSTFHQTLPITAKISRSTTHITKPTRHQVPIVFFTPREIRMATTSS